jgi:hypothetical protein
VVGVPVHLEPDQGESVMGVEDGFGELLEEKVGPEPEAVFESEHVIGSQDELQFCAALVETIDLGVTPKVKPLHIERFHLEVR